MRPIYFSFNRVEEEENNSYDRSKLLGVPAVPSGFLDDKLTEDDYFIGQINLEEIATEDSPLPKKGFLYFFVDVDTSKAKVLYTEEEPNELITDINDGSDPVSYGDTHALYMDFDDNEEDGCAILSDKGEDIGLESFLEDGDYEILLLLDSLSMPDGDQKALTFADIAPYDGYYVFLIKRDDLAKHDFSKVLFLDWGS